MAIDGTKKMLSAEAMQEEMERRKQSTEQDAIESVNEEASTEEARVRVGRPRGSLAFTSRKNLGPEDWSRPLPDQALLNDHDRAGSSTAPPEIPVLSMKLSKKSSSRGPNPFVAGGRPSLVKRASSALASPRMLIKSASSAFVQIQEGTKEVLSALRPGLDGVAVGIDVLGIDMPGGAPSGVPPPPRLQETMSSHFEEEELFEVDVSGENAETLIAGEGLTSAVLREGMRDDGQPTLDWAEELLLLSHEPLRRDMLEMQRALQVGYFGDLPESWRVRAFFRFFNCWCLLVSQQQAVEVAVHYDWLVHPTGKMEDETRREVLAYHRRVELEMHSISRLENVTSRVARHSQAPPPPRRRPRTDRRGGRGFPRRETVGSRRATDDARHHVRLTLLFDLKSASVRDAAARRVAAQGAARHIHLRVPSDGE